MQNSVPICYDFQFKTILRGTQQGFWLFSLQTSAPRFGANGPLGWGEGGSNLKTS